MRSKLLSILLVFILAFSLITPVYATETTAPVNITLPVLPEYTATPDIVNYKIEKAVLKVGTDYYAIVYEDDIDATISGFGIKSYSNSSGTTCYGITFYPYAHYTETYKLSEDGTTWVFVYETGEATSSTTNFALKDESGMSYDSWHEGYAAKTIAVYSTYSSINISSRDRLPNGYYYAVAPTDYYNVSFTGGSVDGGDTTEPTDPDDSGGSSEGGGFTGGWSDEDKGWLGNLFDDLFSFFNNWWTTKIQPKLDSITTSIGNYIDSATENIKNGFSEILTTIFGPIVDSITDLFETQLNLIDKIINLIVNLWDNFKSYTFEPVNEFLNGINTTAINLWLDIFNLPMISDILLISVIIGIFGGLMSFLKSR